MNFETEPITYEIDKPVIPWLLIWRIIITLLILIDIIVNLGTNEAVMRLYETIN